MLSARFVLSYWYNYLAHLWSMLASINTHLNWLTSLFGPKLSRGTRNCCWSALLWAVSLLCKKTCISSQMNKWAVLSRRDAKGLNFKMIMKTELVIHSTVWKYIGLELHSVTDNSPTFTQSTHLHPSLSLKDLQVISFQGCGTLAFFSPSVIRGWSVWWDCSVRICLWLLPKMILFASLPGYVVLPCFAAVPDESTGSMPKHNM